MDMDIRTMAILILTLILIIEIIFLTTLIEKLYLCGKAFL